MKNKCKICGETFGSINNDGEFKNRIYIDIAQNKTSESYCVHIVILSWLSKDSDMVLIKL